VIPTPLSRLALHLGIAKAAWDKERTLPPDLSDIVSEVPSRDVAAD
jgi:hypothetical protein